MNRSLWSISDDLAALGDRLIESGGVLDESDESLLDGLAGEFDAKVERIGQLVRTLRVDAAAAKAEATRLDSIAKAREGAAARLATYIYESMKRADRVRVDTPTIQVRRQANGAPTIRWVGDGAPPEEVAVVKVEFSATKAKELLAANKPLPEGVQVERGEHLRGL